jgi:hypothetical protein
MVEIRCKPVAADKWQADFDKKILHSSEEVIKNGDGKMGILPAIRMFVVSGFRSDGYPPPAEWVCKTPERNS